MTNTLCTVDETCLLIQAGKPLLLAASEAALSQLPAGPWIGGTTSYFMSADGGVFDDTRVFVTELPVDWTDCRFAAYDATDISRIVEDGPDGSLTYVILPAFSAVHETYAKGAPQFPGMYIRPIVGWVAGVAVEDIGKRSPRTYFGPNGGSYDAKAVAVHIALPAGTDARVDIVNLFEPGDGPVIEFDAPAFNATTCLIDGKHRSLAEYIAAEDIDTRLPLVADFCGAIINTSVASVDAAAGTVAFYAPVFPLVQYRLARPVGNYAETFEKKVPKGLEPVFSCNCILNYLYGSLEGKHLSIGFGPVTFGEVAYQLLNQTMVFVEYDRAA